MIIRVVYGLFREAAQNFLGKDVSEIQAIAHHTLEGHQRSIMGKMTVEEILQNKQKFGEEVFEIATVGTDDFFIKRNINYPLAISVWYLLCSCTRNLSFE